MITVSEGALPHLAQLVAAEGGAGSAVRIAVIGGIAGPGLGLVVDSAGETDETILFEDLAIIIDRQLHTFCRNILIDFREGQPEGCAGKSGAGFLIIPDQPINF
jgi:Fe-S cluster assembly iron-binding protein IscA